MTVSEIVESPRGMLATEGNKVLKKGEVLQLKVEDLAFGGMGISKWEGKVVFVKGGLPGDLVEAQITKVKSSYSEAQMVKLLQPSSHRIPPSCPHFGVCGGCKLQDLDYGTQLSFKEKHVGDNLKRIGGVPDPPLRKIIGADKIYFYRNKMEFTFSTLDEEPILGLHKSGSFNQVFDLKRCLLQSELSNRILFQVREFVRQKGLSVYDLKRHKGLLRFLTIREGKLSGEVMVSIVTSEEKFLQMSELAQLLAEKFPHIVSVFQIINPWRASVALGEARLIWGEPKITEKIGEYDFSISPNSFFQTNPYQAERLYRLVRDLSRLEGIETIFDLYAGTGSIGIFLAKSARKVIGIESQEGAVIDARRNAESNGMENCQFIQGEVKDLLAQIKKRPDLAVVDPPRAGMHPKAIRALLKVSPPRIIYVSCNPSTLARDLALICEGGYKLKEVHPLDMFPHTYHIESVALIEKG